MIPLPDHIAAERSVVAKAAFDTFAGRLRRLWLSRDESSATPYIDLVGMTMVGVPREWSSVWRDELGEAVFDSLDKRNRGDATNSLNHTGTPSFLTLMVYSIQYNTGDDWASLAFGLFDAELSKALWLAKSMPDDRTAACALVLGINGISDHDQIREWMTLDPVAAVKLCARDEVDHRLITTCLRGDVDPDLARSFVDSLALSGR